MSNVPAVIVNALAIPKTALDDNCNEVPLMVALYRLAIPLSDEAPVKVVVPDEAVKLPLTFNTAEMVRSAVVVIAPEINNVLNDFEPEPLMVLEVPVI